MGIFYTMLYSLALAILFPFELLKRAPGLRATWLREKSGRIALSPVPEGGRTLWVHAVSVGESIAAATLIKAYKALHPDDRVVLSTITDTGRAVAQSRLKGAAEIIYLPFDLPGPLNGAFETMRPDLLILMETELWPNLVRIASLQGVPVAIVNCRISVHSYPVYLRILPFIRAMLRQMSSFCMQDEGYARRIKKLGADAKKVNITGSLKFDIKVKLEEVELVSRLSGPIMIAGSTHKGEEDLVLGAYMGLKQSIPGLSLIIAPRHPQRFEEVWDIIQAANVPCVKRSEVEAMPAVSGAVVLLDTVGELSSVYSKVDLVVMGGSFIPHGGQNPLEPAYWGKTVLCGPHMENFPFIEEFYAEGAAVKTSRESLVKEIKRLFDSQQELKDTGERARALLERNRGAVDKTLGIIEHLLGRD